MDYLRGPDLFSLFEQEGAAFFRDDDLLRTVITGVSSALNYMHGMQIVHRNIKLENIVFTDDSLTQVKIINFGDAGYLDSNGRASNVCGSMGYLAPEIFDKESYSSDIDIWSLGVVMYALLIGLMPY